MKKYFMGALLVTILVVTGIFMGCYVSETRSTTYSQPSQEYYYAHEGRVYQRDHPGNFYVYEADRRGPPVQDRTYTVRIETEGKQFRNYNEANEHVKQNKGNKGNNQGNHENNQGNHGNK